MRASALKRLARFATSALVTLLFARCTENQEPKGHESSTQLVRPTTFDGPSTRLEQTQFVPTLDTPIQQGKNVIWCASFQAAWKKLQQDIAGEPIRIPGAQALVSRVRNSFAYPASNRRRGQGATTKTWQRHFEEEQRRQRRRGPLER